MLIVRFVEFAGQPVDVCRGGEPFVHHVVAGTAEVDSTDERAQRRAHCTVVEQFAGMQPLRVRGPAGKHTIRCQRYEVGGGAADVHQDSACVSASQPRSHQPGSGRPVGGSKLTPAATGLVGRDPLAAVAEQAHAGSETQLEMPCESFDAVPAIVEPVHHFAGHRHGVRGGAGLGAIVAATAPDTAPTAWQPPSS